MEFKTCAEFSIKKGDNVYTLHVPPNATHGELLDVAAQLLEEAKLRAIAFAEKIAPKEVPATQEPGK